MRESRIKRDPALREPNRVSRIAIDKLVAHPDNPNRMSRANFAKLVRNIERTGRYDQRASSLAGLARAWL